MRNRFIRFMQGRYGMDSLSRLLTYISLGFCFVSFFVPYIFCVTILLIGYIYFRTFSRNISKRKAENDKYLAAIKRMKDRKTHRIFKCPNCRQRIRVPKKKGRICIKCPKCRIEFIRKT